MISVMSRSLKGQIVAKWPHVPVSLQDGLPNGNLEVDQANASIISELRAGEKCTLIYVKNPVETSLNEEYGYNNF